MIGGRTLNLLFPDAISQCCLLPHRNTLRVGNLRSQPMLGLHPVGQTLGRKYAGDTFLCNTGSMAPIAVSTSSAISDAEILSLYNSVGWSAYTNSPDVLFQAIKSSSFVVSAWSEDGKLVGLARTISDDATICYLQDILVHPDFHRTGVGRSLVEQVLERYHHVRQTVLITDDEPQQRAFYESMGLTEGADFPVGPVRVFAKFR